MAIVKNCHHPHHYTPYFFTCNWLYYGLGPSCKTLQDAWVGGLGVEYLAEVHIQVDDKLDRKAMREVSRKIEESEQEAIEEGMKAWRQEDWEAGRCEGRRRTLWNFMIIWFWAIYNRIRVLILWAIIWFYPQALIWRATLGPVQLFSHCVCSQGINDTWTDWHEPETNYTLRTVPIER